MVVQALGRLEEAEEWLRFLMRSAARVVRVRWQARHVCSVHEVVRQGSH